MYHCMCCCFRCYHLFPFFFLELHRVKLPISPLSCHLKSYNDYSLDLCQELNLVNFILFDTSRLASSGFVLGKKMPQEKRKRSVQDSSCWEMKAMFQNITSWNHDSLPSENDAFLRAFHLFSVTTAVRLHTCYWEMPFLPYLFDYP